MVLEQFEDLLVRILLVAAVISFVSSLVVIGASVLSTLKGGFPRVKYFIEQKIIEFALIMSSGNPP